MAENSRFWIYMDELFTGGALAVPDYLVVTPKRVSRNLVTGVGVVPIFGGRVGLIRTYRHAVAEAVWEIPRGFVEDDESPSDAALRELEEETGLVCPRAALRSLGFVMPEPGIVSARVGLFAALKCVAKRTYRPSEIGHLEFRLFKPDELRVMIKRSEIKDAVSLVACTKYLAGLFSR